MGKAKMSRLEIRAIEAAVAGRLIKAFAQETGMELAQANSPDGQ